jgi:AraC-like DNA-binding protein
LTTISPNVLSGHVSLAPECPHSGRGRASFKVPDQAGEGELTGTEDLVRMFVCGARRGLSVARVIAVRRGRQLDGARVGREQSHLGRVRRPGGDPVPQQGLEHGGWQDEGHHCGVRERLEVHRLAVVPEQELLGRHSWKSVIPTSRARVARPLTPTSPICRAPTADSDLSPAMLAGALHVSVRTLERAFASLGEGEPAAAYIRRRRLEEARLALTAPSNRLTISELAAYWQFADSSHLARAFNKRYGLTPSEYARSTRPRGASSR